MSPVCIIVSDRTLTGNMRNCRHSRSLPQAKASPEQMVTRRRDFRSLWNGRGCDAMHWQSEGDQQCRFSTFSVVFSVPCCQDSAAVESSWFVFSAHLVLTVYARGSESYRIAMHL